MTTTPNRGYPKPAATDPVANGWDAIGDLADAVDADVANLRSVPASESARAGTDFGVVNGGVTTGTAPDTEVEEGITHAAGTWTIPEAGRYLLTGWLKQYPLTAPHNGVQLWFGVNGDTVAPAAGPSAYAGDANLANDQTLAVTDVRRLAAGDTVQLLMQGIGGQTTVKRCRATITKLGD